MRSPRVLRATPALLASWCLFALPVPGLRAPAAEPGAEGWQSLFDGRSLDGWRANEAGQSFRVEDGAIVANGPRCHLFYVGPGGKAEFADFEFEAEVRTAPGANSGVYFHTAYQQQDWLQQGHEVQINNTATGEGGYRENKRTGSLYGVRNVYKQLVPDNAWFTLRISVHSPRIVIRVNDIETVNYVEPADAPNAGYRDRRIARGTFALQGHDPASRVQFRNLRARVMPPEIPAPDASPYRISPDLATLYANNFPVLDLHTHLKGGLTMADVLQRQFRTGIGAGVAVNCGLGFALTNDAGIDRALAEIRHPLVYTAMQAEGREWVKLFSRAAIAKFDYVFTDAMTIFNDQGKRMRLWIPAEVEVGDPEAFVEMLVARTVEILEREPIDVWVNPTFLPAPLDREHDRWWTPERRQRAIAAAAKNGVAIEINDRFKLPGAAFIRQAKKAGVKFTFGTNNGGRDDLGHLDHCVRMVQECGLTWQDLWVPGARPGRASSQRP